MPKRKLPKLWYSKNDYKKERENETKETLEQIQNDDLTKTTVKNETAEPLSVENHTQPNEIDNPSSAHSDTFPQAEKENQSTTIENNVQPNEISDAPTENQTKQLENDNKSEPQQINETPSMQSDIKGTIAEIENKSEPIAASPTPTESPLETTEPVKVNENKETALEPKINAMSMENPIQIENNGTPVEAIATIEAVTEATATIVENKVALAESEEKIEKNTAVLKHLLPTRAVVCIGEYPINIVLKGVFSSMKDQDVLPIFVEKSVKDVIKWGKGRLDLKNIVGVDEDIDAHFWYDLLPYLVENENFFAHIKSMSVEKLRSAIFVSATWSGIGSALLPTMNSQFNEWNIKTAGLAILPSKAQPLDGQFNSLASIGIYSSKEATTLILIDRDNLEDYTGVDRNGYVISGNIAANYLLDLMLTKETFVQELSELSESFDSKIFTVLLASGESLKIYDSIENMLNTALLKPLFAFDLSSATLLYVLVRMPVHLRDKLPRGKIELAIANWFKDKANLESIYVSDPVYVEDTSDRIDIGLFVGGFETATRFTALDKKVTKVKNQAIKKGSITEEDWQTIVKSLLK
ncbi:MAG TPA: hypothetical protein VLU95_04930 [Candidatus Acidoferrum sp.]|nr:hypothetical protein [Candidatus Acidoferrum sp.]